MRNEHDAGEETVTRAHPTLEEGHLADHLAVLRRRWRTVLVTFVAFTTVATVANVRLPKLYRATTRIMIGGTWGGGLLSDRLSPMEGYLLERRSFETQLEVIRSEPVALLAAERLGRIGADATEEERSRAAQGVKGSVSVGHLADTRIVLISGHAGTPEAARELADAVAGAYIDYARDRGSEARTASIAWLTGEIEDLRGRLRSSEERLLDYLAEHEVGPAGDAGAEAAPEPRSSARREELAAAEAALSELLGRYRERHPKVVEARARVRALSGRIAAENERHAESQRTLIQYRLLKRDAALDHQMYEVLLKKLKETDLSQGVGESDIRVLESAKRPFAPIAPRLARNVGVAAVLALCLAIALAYGVEYFDRGVASPEDVRRALALPTLGIVSSFANETDSLAAGRVGSLEAERFRTLRSNVRFSHVDKPRRVVLVTSTGPAEGKSTILANLGVSLAQSGRRTLLLDTDLRRPTLHKLFGFAKGRGLADILAGDVALEETIRGSHVEGLDVMPCGTVPVNPAELIESVRLQELLASLRERYDYVLLDSPPAGGLVDASLLSSLADGVLFVVEPRRYDWRLLRATLGQLERAGARVYGAVLNKAVRDDGAPLYGYYHYGRDEGDEADASAAGAA